MILGLVAGRRRRAAAPVVAAPVNLAVPVLSGVAEVGQALAASPGLWTGSPFPAFAYQWLRDGVPLLGATAPVYALTPFDEAHEVSVRVTATNVAGSASAVSAGVVVAAPPVTGDVWPTSGVWPGSGVWPSDTGPDPEPGAWPSFGVWPSSGLFYD